MKTKNLKVLFVVLFSGWLFSPLVGAQLAGTQRVTENQWMAGDKKVQFGAYPNAEIYYNGTNLVIDVTNGGGKVSIPDGLTLTGSTINGSVIGGVTPAAATVTNLTATGSVTFSAATNIGWSVVSGANTACNTTCTNACVFGQDTGTNAIVDCASALADKCVCAGAN